MFQKSCLETYMCFSQNSVNKMLILYLQTCLQSNVFMQISKNTFEQKPEATADTKPVVQYIEHNKISLQHKCTQYSVYMAFWTSMF